MLLFATMCVAALGGTLLQQRRGPDDKAAPDGKADSKSSDGQEGYIVSAVLGLLAVGLNAGLCLAYLDYYKDMLKRHALTVGEA